MNRHFIILYNKEKVKVFYVEKLVEKLINNFVIYVDKSGKKPCQEGKWLKISQNRGRTPVRV